MKIIDYLFKKDHTGQRRPTLPFILILVCLVFGSYFMSGSGEKAPEEIKTDPVINYKDVTSTTNEYSKKAQQEDLIKPLLFSKPVEKPKPKETIIEKFAEKHERKEKKVVNSLIYDTTLSSRTREREVKMPLGSMVQCLLIHNIITNNFSSPVIVQVKKDFYFNGRLLFPRDTRIFGEARAGRERDRVLVAFRTVLFEDGYEVNFKGRGLDADGSGGFKAEIISEKTKEKILSKVLHFLSGTLLGLQEKSTNALTGIDQVDVTSRNAILEGSAKAFTEEAKRMEKEIDEAKGYGIVPAGTEIILYVDESFKLTQKGIQMREGALVILLIIAIAYFRYQEYVLLVFQSPFLMICVLLAGGLLYGTYYLVQHVLEKVGNRIKMHRAGVNTTIKDKGTAYPFISFDIIPALQGFVRDGRSDQLTFIGLNAQRKNKGHVALPDIQRTQHLQVLGMTGTGKSTSVFYPLIYQDALKKRPVIIIDAKGEMSAINTLNGILAEVGRSDDFLLFSLSHKELSCSYNPLYVGQYDPQVVIDAFFSNYDDQNTFFREMSKMIFSHAFFILHSLGKPFSPMDVYCYLNNEYCRQEINKQIVSANETGWLRLKLLNQVISDLQDQYKGWRHVIAGFNNFLMGFNDPLLNEDDSDIVLSEVIREGKVVYFQLPTNAYPLQAVAIARMVQANLRYISSMIQTGQLSNDLLVSVLIDEYGAFAEQTFVEVLNKARSSRMMVTLAHQSLGDLQNISGTFMKLIDENTLNKIYLKQTDPELAELIARSMGTFTKQEQTFRMTAGSYGNQIHTGETSNKTVQEFYFSPDKVKNLYKHGQGYLIYKGDNSQQCVNFGQFSGIKEKPYVKPVRKNKREGLKLFERYYLRDEKISPPPPRRKRGKKGEIALDD